MAQDVTMIDGTAREILKRDPNPHTFAHGHVDDVSPSPEARALIIFAYEDPAARAELPGAGVDYSTLTSLSIPPIR